MPIPKKQAEHRRINLYLDKKLYKWIEEESKKLGLNETAFTRMIIIEAHNAQIQG